MTYNYSSYATHWSWKKGLTGSYQQTICQDIIKVGAKYTHNWDVVSASCWSPYIRYGEFLSTVGEPEQTGIPAESALLKTFNEPDMTYLAGGWHNTYIHPTEAAVHYKAVVDTYAGLDFALPAVSALPEFRQWLPDFINAYQSMYGVKPPGSSIAYHCHADLPNLIEYTEWVRSIRSQYGYQYLILDEYSIRKAWHPTDWRQQLWGMIEYVDSQSDIVAALYFSNRHAPNWAPIFQPPTEDGYITIDWDTGQRTEVGEILRVAKTGVTPPWA